MTKTWNVVERQIIVHDGTVVREHVVAICASKQLAIDEVSRLIEETDFDWSMPDWAHRSYYVKPGEILIGFTVVP